MLSDARLGHPISRRGVLSVLLVVSTPALVAGCTTGGEPDPEPTTPDPDDALRARIAESERALIDLYTAVSLAHPQLGEQLAPYADRHEEHLRALQPGPPSDPSESPTATATATPSPSPTLVAPDSPETSLAALRDLERQAADLRVALCTAAVDPNLSRLLASIAGCEAAHVALLGAGR